MIITFILTLLYNMIAGLINLLPVGSIPNGFDVAIQYVFTVFPVINYLVPVSTALTLLGYALAFHAAIWTFTLIMWIYGLIRG